MNENEMHKNIYLNESYQKYNRYINKTIIDFNTVQKIKNTNYDEIDKILMIHIIHHDEIIPNYLKKFCLECILLTYIFIFVNFDFEDFFKTFMMKNEMNTIKMLFKKSKDFENKINKTINEFHSDFDFENLSIIKNIKNSLQKYQFNYIQFTNKYKNTNT